MIFYLLIYKFKHEVRCIKLNMNILIYYPGRRHHRKVTFIVNGEQETAEVKPNRFKECNQ